LFYHLRKYIFLYYCITNILFVGGFWYANYALQVTNIYILMTVFLILIIISGLVISKLSIETLEEYIKNLEELSADTLHELNLPIATIKTNVDMLRKNLTDDKALKRLERVEMASKMVVDSYNDIDYMIKQQIRRERVDDFDLQDLIYERVEFLRGIYPYVEFSMNLESFLIKIDKIGLSKVLDNIVDNGIKYSDTIYKIDIELKNGLLSITDNGIGIDEVALLSVFDRYYQNDDSMPGFGIGLSMVKRFCDQNHIKLNIRSKKNSGTTLFLDFKGK
jgi:two-component system, OmpR family, sensor kinase